MSCALCETLEGTSDRLILRTDRFAILHKEPPVQLPGWILIVPLRHIEHQIELSDLEIAELGKMEREFTGLLNRCFAAERVYWLCYSEMVRHIHFHLIPRRDDHPAQFRGPAIFQTPGELTDEEIQRAVELLRAESASLNF